MFHVGGGGVYNYCWSPNTCHYCPTVCFRLWFVLVVVVINMITKYFHPTRITASVLRCQPSLDWERMQGFQTQKRLYNCRCPSVIITFFKIFSRKNDSTFVNVRPSSSLSSNLIILINWKVSSFFSVFLGAIKVRLQKKEGNYRGRWGSHEKNQMS